MISVKQLSYLTVILIFSTGILYLPSITIRHAGNGGWLSPFISMMVGIMVLFIILFFHYQFTSKTLTEYLPLLVGKWGARLLGALYVLFFWSTGLLVVREMVGIVRITLLPKTPIVVICFMIALAIIYGAYCKMEAIARLIELIVLLLPVMVIALITGLAGAIHWGAFFPFIEAGWRGVIRGAFVPSSWFGEIIVLAYLLPIVSSHHRSFSILLFSLGITAGLLSIIVMLIIGVFGASEAARTPLATYELIRYVQFGSFLQHIDALFLFPWLMFMLVKGLLFFYVAMISFSQTIVIPSYQFTIIPLVFLSTVVSHWMFLDDATVSKFLEVVWPVYALFFEAAVPLLLLVLYFVRHRKIQTIRMSP